MKVTDLRRKLLATLAAGGMLAPGAARAANLNTNLIVNPSFENVDFGTLGAGGGPLIRDWAGLGFTYSHDGTGGVPNFANGSPPPDGGSFYFYPASSGGGGTAHHSLASAISQVIDLSAGQSGALIATGAAGFRLSGYFSGYLTQADHGVVQVDFLDAADAPLGSGQISPGPGPLFDWTEVVGGGAIPLGTAKVKVSSWGVLLAGGGSDGYTDNLDFQVTNNLPTLSLTVDRSTGALTLRNQTGAAENISGYTITSAFEALTPATWLSITDNYDSGNPGLNQVDPAHAWTEDSDPNGHAALTESDPSTAGAALANGRSVNLGAAWIRNHNQDLAFTYTSDGAPVTGSVAYINGPGGGGALAEGDVNVDGAINAADWAIVRNNQFGNLGGLSLAEAYRAGDFNGDLKNDHADFAEFKRLYDAANGVGSFDVMAAGVPEPSTVVLVGVAGLAVLARSRRRIHRA